MNGLKYTLRLLEPVLANSLAGDTNSARSLPYVPGSLIRGAVIGTLLAEDHQIQANAADMDFRRMFISGETRFLHAYPLGEEIRSLPAPLSWKVRKDEIAGNENTPINLFNYARAESAFDDLKGVSFDNWWQLGESVYSQEVPFQVNVHTQRDAVFGRAREGQGAVYRYEALPAGLQLEGIILTDDFNDIARLKHLLNGRDLLLGKARTAGYGRAQIVAVDELSEIWCEGLKWREHTAAEDSEQEFEPPKTVDEFILTFISAALVRDSHGQFSLDPMFALETRLDTKLSLGEVKSHVFRSSEIVGGFNRVWGLPLPQVIAIAPGSVFVIQATTPLPVEKLQLLEATGLGERRAEGFGRVAIDFYQPEVISWRKIAEKKTRPPKPENLSEDETALAQMILKRLLRRELDKKTLDVAQRIADKYQGAKGVPNSQLSRWRVILRSAIGKDEPAEKLTRLTKFYAAERDKRNPGWKKMESVRVSGYIIENERRIEKSLRLTEWIEQVLNGEGEPWLQLDYAPNGPGKRLGSASYKSDEGLAVEYRLRLIDAVLAICTKKNAIKSKGGPHD
jgi:CRISPR-associated protein Csx10